MKTKLFGLSIKTHIVSLSLSLFTLFQTLHTAPIELYEDSGHLKKSVEEFISELIYKEIFTSENKAISSTPEALVKAVYQNRISLDHLSKHQLQQLQNQLHNLNFLEETPFIGSEKSACDAFLVYGAKFIRMNLRIQRIKTLLSQVISKPKTIFFLCSNRPLKDAFETWENSKEWQEVKSYFTLEELESFFPTVSDRTEASLMKAFVNRHITPLNHNKLSNLVFIESTKTRFKHSSRPTTIDTIDSLVAYVKTHQVEFKSLLIPIELPYAHRMALSTTNVLRESGILPEHIHYDFIYPMTVPLKIHLMEFIKHLALQNQCVRN